MIIIPDDCPTKLRKQLERQYPLKDIPIQLELVNHPARIKVVPAGRRSGKTERAKRHLVKKSAAIPGKYFIGAPTYPQVKKIYWDDMLDLTVSCMQQKPNRSELIIHNCDSEIHLIGLDQPTRFEGVDWAGGIIDEAAYLKENVLNETVFPALDTEKPLNPGYKAWAWIIGKPAGLNHYYRLYNYALQQMKINPLEWAAFTWKSSAVLSPEAISAAKDRMSLRQFRQEYEASFETVAGRIYEDFNQDNVTDAIIKEHEQLHYYIDINYTPMSHGIAVIRDDNVYCLDEIILESAVTLDNAKEFVHRYKDHKNKNLKLYGDASGKAGEKHGKESAYTQMEDYLRSNGWNVDRCVKSANPAIIDRQNAVRAKVCNAHGVRSVFVNPQTAPWHYEGFMTVQVKEGSAFLEDDKNKYQHIMTAVGYFIEYKFGLDIAPGIGDIMLF